MDDASGSYVLNVVLYALKKNFVIKTTTVLYGLTRPGNFMLTLRLAICDHAVGSPQVFPRSSLLIVSIVALDLGT
jgi:hypothetical protein